MCNYWDPKYYTSECLLKKAQYHCDSDDGIVVGGAEAKLNEFPHMAGRIIKFFKILNYN